MYAPAGEQFVCLEPMTAPGNALVDGTYEVAPPGGARSATFSVAVTSAPRAAGEDKPPSVVRGQ